MRWIAVSIAALCAAALAGCAEQGASSPGALPPLPTAPVTVEPTASPLRVAAPPAPPIDEGAWSAPVQGVRARLVATPGAGNTALDLEVELAPGESAPVAIGWGDLNEMLRFAPFDANGAAITTDAVPGGNSIAAPPHWVVLKKGEPVRLRIVDRAFEKSTYLRPLTFQGWPVPAGALYVAAKLTPVKVDGAPGAPPLASSIELPRVRLR